MADGSGISWTDATWNVLRGCKVVSPGCTNCYAMSTAHRYSERKDGTPGPYHGLTVVKGGHPVWNGEVRVVEHLLDQPLRWQKSRLIFANSMSDLFYEEVPFDLLDRIFAVMVASPQHVFQVLTKRHERMWEYMGGPRGPHGIRRGTEEYVKRARNNLDVSTRQRAAWGVWQWPPPNIWLGVSVEDQPRANERIPVLLDTPAQVRFLSCEPLIGPVDLWEAVRCPRCGDSRSVPVPGGGTACPQCFDAPGLGDLLHWVIVGGESGPDRRRREMNLTWALRLLYQCQNAGVPYFFKQASGRVSGLRPDALGQVYHEFPVSAPAWVHQRALETEVEAVPS